MDWVMWRVAYNVWRTPRPSFDGSPNDNCIVVTVQAKARCKSCRALSYLAKRQTPNIAIQEALAASSQRQQQRSLHATAIFDMPKAAHGASDQTARCTAPQRVNLPIGNSWNGNVELKKCHLPRIVTAFCAVFCVCVFFFVRACVSDCHKYGCRSTVSKCMHLNGQKAFQAKCQAR